MGTVTLLVVFNTILLVIPFHEVTNFFELEAFFFNHTLKFRLILLCLVGVNLVISLLIEVRPLNSYFLPTTEQSKNIYLDHCTVISFL